MRRQRGSELGANMAEYAFIILGVLLVVVAAVATLGQVNAPAFDRTNQAFQGGGDPGGGDPGGGAPDGGGGDPNAGG